MPRCASFVHSRHHASAWSRCPRPAQRGDMLCSAHRDALDGIVTGIVTGIGQTVTPYIEYYANNMPERLMGVFGIGLILCGFALQSMQYWLTLFDVRLS